MENELPVLHNTAQNNYGYDQPKQYPPAPSYNYSSSAGQQTQGTFNQTYVVGPTSTVQPVMVQPVYLGNRSYLNFTGAIILSCFTYWCCGWLFGLIAFILAMVGQSSSNSGDIGSARSMLISSYVLSIIGIIIGIGVIIFLIVYFTTVAKCINNYCNYG